LKEGRSIKALIKERHFSLLPPTSSRLGVGKGKRLGGDIGRTTNPN